MAADPKRRVRAVRSAEDRARHEAIRRCFHHEPSLTELLASSEITSETYECARRTQAEGPTIRCVDDTVTR